MKAKEKRTWSDEINRLISQTREAHEAAVAEFNKKAENWCLSEAIAWCGAGVTRRETEWHMLKPLAAYLEEDNTNPANVLEWVKEKRRDAYNSFRFAASTSPFSNAVENEKTEARMRMFDHMGGMFTRIEYILEDAVKEAKEQTK